VTGPVSKRPWSQTAIPAARRWIVLPLALALIGGAAGYVAATSSPASAEALLLVRTDAFDNTSQQLAAENAAVELDTLEVFTAAAKKTGGDPRDLKSRTEIAAVPNSQTVSLSVTAATQEQAVADASAVFDAALAAGPSRTPEALEQMTKATRDLIESKDLGNSTAEEARVDRLGDELGASQAALVADANQIQPLQSAEPSSRLPEAPVLGLMGALSGVLLGLGLALLLGMRRGTVRSASDLSELYPQAAVISSSDIEQALEMEPGASTVIIASTRGARVSGLTRDVQEAMAAATGKQVVIADSLAHAPIGESPNGHISLVSTTLSETVLRRTRKDPGTLLFVPVQPRITKLDAVNEYAPRLADRSYLLVDSRPEWE
jgi:hypothetical protein